MMTFFRRFATSPVGVAIFGVILIAFVVTLYEGKSAFGGAGLIGGAGGSLAKVGSVTIDEAEAQRRVQTQLEAIRQQRPELDLPAFVQQGGVELTVDRMIDVAAMAQFAAQNGLVASRKLVDGAIASIPAFNGVTGQFDRNRFLQILSQRKIPENQLRADFASDAVSKMLLVPVQGGARVPTGLVQPYAALMLEARQGRVAIVPTAAFASNAPLSDAELATFYKRNIGRYTVPERRTIKYALFDRSRFAGTIVPTEAEITAAYKAGAARYAGRETRTLTQVIVPAAATAQAVLAKVKGGMAIAEAAKSIGLEPLSVAATDKAAFVRLTSAAVADAAFAAPKGGYAALAQSGLGYHIVRVDSVAAIAAKTLEQARPELVADLTKTKVETAMSDLVAKIEDDISGGATFDDIAKKYALTPAATPPITARGLAPDVQGYTLPPELQPVLKDAFQAEAGDDPQVASVTQGASFALYHMDNVTPSAARPLTATRAQVVADAQVGRAVLAAKRVADAIVAKVNAGVAFDQALAGAGKPLPPARPVAARRIDIAQGGEKVPLPVKLLFGVPGGKAGAVAAPQGAGWFVAVVDKIVPGDIAQAPQLVAATQSQLARVVGEEYARQFAGSIRKQVGVARNDGAIAAFRRTLTGTGQR